MVDFGKLFAQAQQQKKPQEKNKKKRDATGSKPLPQTNKKPKVEIKVQSPVEALSQSQKKKLKKKLKAQNKVETKAPGKKDDAAPVPGGKKMSLQAKMKASQFRNLNETLYTSESKAAWDLFQQAPPPSSTEPALFDTYHAGFREQVEKWPVNPVDVFIEFLQTAPKKLVVADFGCGEAAIAAAAPQKVHSFDLAAVNEHVTACDMSNVPLEDGVVDVAIFSLALMGTNYEDFVWEAARVLKVGGTLKIAEVVSRFADFKAFEKGLAALGFKVTKKDTSNTHFTLLDATKLKTVEKPEERLMPALKPCIYKRR